MQWLVCVDCTLPDEVGAKATRSAIRVPMPFLCYSSPALQRLTLSIVAHFKSWMLSLFSHRILSKRSGHHLLNRSLHLYGTVIERPGMADLVLASLICLQISFRDWGKMEMTCKT